jgi:hypothetical protein
MQPLTLQARRSWKCSLWMRGNRSRRCDRISGNRPTAISGNRPTAISGNRPTAISGTAEPDPAGRVHVLSRAHTRTHTRAHTHAHTRARTHRRAQTHAHTHTRTHTRWLPAAPAGPHLPDGRQTEPRAGRPRVLLRHQHPGKPPARLGSPRPHLRRDWAHPAHICAGTGLAPLTSALGLGHICAGTGLALPTSAPGLGSPRPHLRRDWARPAHVCAGTCYWADPSRAQCPNYVPSMFKTQEDGPGY